VEAFKRGTGILPLKGRRFPKKRRKRSLARCPCYSIAQPPRLPWNQNYLSHRLDALHKRFHGDYSLARSVVVKILRPRAVAVRHLRQPAIALVILILRLLGRARPALNLRQPLLGRIVGVRLVRVKRQIARPVALALERLLGAPPPVRVTSVSEEICRLGLTVSRTRRRWHRKSPP
jgi:hypothetical protein